MADNLPPGCTSPDGGIDHAFESALDNLVQSFDYAEDVILCEKIWVAMKPLLKENRQNAIDELMESEK